MKHLLIISAVFFLTSCGSTYFYTSLSSPDYDMAQNEDGDFIAENDSVLVAYWFNGKDAPLFINVYNKTETPLYVDWSRSSLIIGDEATTYKGMVVDMADDYGYGEELSFIPPGARTTFNAMPFTWLSYENIGKKQYKNGKMPDKDGMMHRVDIAKFDEMDTPMRFSSYITMYKNPDKPFTAEHNFYISKIIKSAGLTPKNATDNFFKRGDVFYLEKENKGKYVAGDILLGTAIAGLVVVGIVWGDNDSSGGEYYEEY